MTLRRGESGLSGILPVDKPAGLSSHDVVNRVRRSLGERRVGHAGTLDPMATGILVVLVGPATRLAPYLTAAEKSYVARIAFGTETDTDDAEGTAIRTAKVPQMSADVATAIVAALVGTHEQLPPAFSAIKRDGVVAYRAARNGNPIDLEPRTISVLSAELLHVDPESGSWDVSLTVTKGTYIRSIARDLGRSLNSAAHLGALRRTASGTLCIHDASDLATIEAVTKPAEIAVHLVDPVVALGMPAIEVSGDAALRVSNGSPLDPASAGVLGVETGPIAVVHNGSLLAIYQLSGNALKPDVVIPGGVMGAGGL